MADHYISDLIGTFQGTFLVSQVPVMLNGDAAGGDLSGTYPNPSVVDDSHNHTSATLPATSPPSAHNILSASHGDTLTASVVDGDTIIGNVTPKWSRLAIAIPAANVRNVLGIDNGELRPSWKTALDATNPTTIAAGDAAAPGTSLVFAHRDHTHGSPPTYPATAHALLSATHSDTVADAVVDGDIVIGNVTPKWSRLAISVPAANVRNLLGVDNGELRPSWKTTLDATAPTTIAIADAAAAGTSLVFSHRDHKHGSPATWTATAHNLLSAIHGDTTAASATRGDLVTAQGASPTWSRLAISVPAANVRNVLGIDNGETESSWKTALDATAPTTIAEGDAAAAGTSLIFSHRDHRHGSPSTYAATAHNVLSATHGDALAASVVDGDTIIGNVTPKWSRLAIAIPAANVRNVFGVDNGELRPSWKTTLDSTAPTTIAESDAAAAGTSLVFSHRDHRHGAPATYAATAHNLLSAIHSDTLTASAVRGDVIVGNATPNWSRLAIGTTGKVLHSDGTDATWQALAFADLPSTITAAAFVTIGTDANLTGERALTGTNNQITVTDNGAGSTVVLSTPQNIHTSATPQFARMGLGAAADAVNILTITQPVATTGSPTALKINAGAHTTLTIAEYNDVYFDMSRTVNFAAGGGTLATQRSFLVDAPTYTATTNALTITNTATFAIAGPPVASTNVTLTNTYSFWVQSGTSRLDALLDVNAGVTIRGDGTATGNGLNIANTAQSTGILGLALAVTPATHLGIQRLGGSTHVNFALSNTLTFAAAGSATLADTGGIYILHPVFAAATNPLTITDAATVSIDAAPTAGSNVTITNAWALRIIAGAATLGGTTYIGDSSNADVTLGLTINQAGNDDQIFALKSSDVAHGVTTQAETDTWFAIRKFNANNGGADILAFDDTADTAFRFAGITTTANTTKSTSGKAAIMLDGFLKSGTGVASLGTNGNIVAFRDNGSTKALIDVEGDLWLNGGITVNNDITMSAHNIVSDATTGTSLGSAITQKVSVYGVTPVVQRANANQVAAPAGGTGATAGAYDTSAHRDAMINLVNEMRTVMVNFGMMKGAA